MSKIIEQNKNLLKDALADYNAIKEEAINIAKDRLAKTMPDAIENFLKEEMERSLEESSIVDTEETMIDDQESSVMDTMKDVDSPVSESEEEIEKDHKEDVMEDEKETSDVGDDLTAEAIEDALKELDGDESIDEHDISFEVDFDEDSLNIKNVQSGDQEFDDVEFELEDSELSDDEGSDETKMDTDVDLEIDTDVESDETSPEISDDVDSEDTESDDDELEEDIDIDDINIDELEEEDDEVEEGLSHVMTHQNAKQVGSEGNVNRQKEKNLRPGVRSESKLKGDLEKLIKENDELKEINLGFKDALTKYKKQLYEMAVFNANLSHVNNLFVEHTTNEDEKKEILSKYKTVSTIDESKKLYNDFVTKLNESKSKKKTIEEMANDSRNGDSGSQKLNESISDTSSDSGIKAIKYMMNYIEKNRK